MKWTVTALSFFMAVGVIAVNPAPAAAQTPQQNSAARALFLEGQDLQDEGKFGDAEKKFREALAKYPKSERADKTAYFLITTLVKLGRVADARTEIENFRRNYPQSTWKSDVEEKRIALGGQYQPFIAGIARPLSVPELPEIRKGIQNEIHVLEPPRAFTSVTPFNNALDKDHLVIRTNIDGFESFVVPWSGSASLEQEILRVILGKDPDRGIDLAQDRLKADPSDPAVIANLNTIANSNSPKALPFLVTLAKTSTVPNVRAQALFWMGRKNGDKEAVVRTLMEMLATSKDNKDVEVAVANAMAQFNTAERRAAIDQIVETQSAERIAMLEKIYKNSNNSQVRSQIAQSVSQLSDARTLSLLTDIAKNDKDLSVRRAAIQSLASRKEPEALKTLEDILRTLPAQPR